MNYTNQSKRAAIIAVLAAALVLAACASAGSGGDWDLIVHYYRYNQDYNAGWNLWVWPTDPDGDGAGYQFSRPDREGWVAGRISIDGPVNEFGFIVRRSSSGNEWAEKDTPDDRFTRTGEIWVVQGDAAVYTEKPDVSAVPIQFAVADSPSKVTVTLMKKPSDYGAFSVYQDGARLVGSSEQGRNDRQAIITLTKPISDVSKKLEVRHEAAEFGPKAITLRRILDSYYYDGDDLGLTYSAARSGFKVWAPTAKAVSVALYDDAGTYNNAGRVTDHETANLTAMDRDAAAGVWSAGIAGNLEGKYYMYKIEFSGGTVNYAVDPYARAVSANGQRGYILSLASTNPQGFQPARKPAFSGVMTDAVLYELHVRDFSIDGESGMRNKGKFLAFTERGAKNSAGVPTGLDHMISLGITHVHLLPSFDFASVNELNVDDPQSGSAKFNWGYDPINYNVPEGSYSSDPANPPARIREFKQMVQALHDGGIRVVMDVVYNHTYATGGTPFDAVVPGYYYRTNDQGALTNGSGCGNEVASERPMVRKFILDSVRYWAREYGVDGYRFDLMAIIDRETMRQVSETLHAVDPTIIIYGEPWEAGGSPLPAREQTNVGAQRGMGIAIFNDRIRGSIKGGSDDASKGFATGQVKTEQGIVNGIRGSVDSFTDMPGETINYVTAHDNLNLWDKIATSLGAADLRENPYSLIAQGRPLLENNAVKSVLLANGIILTAQGVPFFQAGDEMLRSKFGNHNSYNAPDNINRIRWENAALYREAVQYYAGLIRLRKSHPAFRMNTKAGMDSIEFLAQEDRLVAFRIGGNANGDNWRTIITAYNASEGNKTLELPAGTWTQVVNAQRAGVDSLGQASGTLTLPPFSMAVLHD